MKISELRSVLAKALPEYMIDKSVHSTAHWVSKIFYSTEYSTADPKEIKTLMKFSGMEIVAVEGNGSNGLTVRLTDEGVELFKDFEKNGFYGSETVKRFFDVTKRK